MTDLYLEIGLVVSGIAVALLGWYLLVGQRRRILLTVAALFFVAGFLAVLLEVGYSLRWRDPLQVVGQPQGVPPVGVAVVTVPVPIPSPIASLTPRPTESPTQTPLPTPTATPTVTPSPTATLPPTVTPTSTATPTPTRVPPRRRLEYRRQEERVRAVLIADLETESQEIIYSEKAPIPVYSAAWSPDGSQILMALRWYDSEEENGAKLVVYDEQTDQTQELFVLDMAQQEAAMGNALWVPSGEKVILYLQTNDESGIYTLKADGTDLQRLPNSVAGEWPRYLSEDEEWIVTVTEDGALFALAANGDLRLPLEEAGLTEFYDQRYEPWRFRSEVRCDVQEESWWKCR